FALDDRGCEICSCASPEEPSCPPVLCALFCENGFASGDDGCPVCRCAEPEPTACGGIAGLACEDGAYCDYLGDSCGRADQMGSCVERPTVCTREFMPVCG